MAGRPDAEYFMLANQEAEQESPLWDYLNVLRRRKWMIIVPLFLVALIGLLSLVLEKPVYEATTMLLIENENPKVIPIQEVITPEDSPDFYATQAKLIKSRAVVAELVDTLRLNERVPAEDAPFVQAMRALKRLPRHVLHTMLSALQDRMEQTPPTQSSGVDAHRLDVIAALQERIAVTPYQDTKLVDITLQGDDPIDVVGQVNMLAEIYIRQNLAHKLDTTRKAVAWLKDEAGSLRDKTNEAEVALERIKAANSFMPADNLGQRQSTTLQRLDHLNASYVENNAVRLQLQTQIDELKKLLRQDTAEILEFPYMSDNPVIRSLKAKFSDLKLKYAGLSSKFGPKHPEMIKTITEIAEVEHNIYLEVQNIIDRLKKEYDVLLAKENMLKKELVSQRTSVLDESSHTRKYNVLQRDLDIDKDLHLAVSKRLAEATLTEALTSNNIRIVERALESLPVSHTAKKLALTLALGLCLGMGLALMAEYLDRRFKNAEEVERSLEIPFLGVIPHHRGMGRGGKPIALREPWSNIAEAYRTLRTWIHLVARKPTTSLLITSATPAEGKTSTAANLAVSFAQLGRKVLVVDTDLRRPSLHRAFGLTNTMGLTDVLIHGNDWRQVLHDTDLANLKVLSTGTMLSNPVELLSTHHMKTLLDDVKVEFDFVILDAPIVLSIPDVCVVAPQVDGVVLVHSPTRRDKGVALQAKHLLARSGVVLVGVVLNNLKQKDMRYYDRHQYQYYNSYNPVKSRHRREKGAPFIDMMPINERSWVPEFLVTCGNTSPPRKVVKLSRSGPVTIILRDVSIQQRLAEKEAGSGLCFIILDIEVLNEAELPHVFHSGSTVLHANLQGGYSRTLASIMEVSSSGEDGKSQELQVCRCDPLTSRIANGLIGEAAIASKGSKHGRLVYRAPVNTDRYVFEYASGDIHINMPFEARQPTSGMTTPRQFS